MLRASNNSNCSKITIYGDYHDLRNLHALIHYYSSSTLLPKHLGHYLLHFASEVRKAYEGSRLKKEFGVDWLDKVSYRGVSIYWPHFLVYVKLLRQAARAMPPLRWHQGVLYSLESLISQALLDFNPSISKSLEVWIDNSHPFNCNFLPQWFETSLRYFLESPKGKNRLNRLLEVSERLSPTSKDYQVFYAHFQSIALQKSCSIFDLEDSTPWPDEEDDTDS